ncbi:MAG: hypothetical protein HY680_08505 [Chloroflexi bacterium]|nr:hypothetical protein [Chloroflexota bacterium]
MIRKDREAEARELRSSGRTFKQIAAELGVGERSVRRWLHGEAAPPGLRRGRPPERTASRYPTGWPETRLWPRDWTLDTLAAMPGLGDAPDFLREAWQGNLALIHSAEADGDLHIPWVFRALVDLAKDNPVPLGNKTLPWAFALASLPVVGQWAGCEGPFQALADAMRAYMPWVNKAARREYLKATREATAEGRQCLRTAQALAVAGSLRGSGAFTLPVLLGALLAKVPEFDRGSLWTLGGRLPLSSVVLGILSHKPVGERGVQ